MVRKKKEFRELKVSSFSGYGYKTAPMLRLQGLWLEQCGFNIGGPILVKCENGKLTITLDEERDRHRDDRPYTRGEDSHQAAEQAHQEHHP